MKPVFDKLRDLEIDPCPESAIAFPNDSSNELTDRVTRRAEQIRNEWNSKDSANAAIT